MSCQGSTGVLRSSEPSPRHLCYRPQHRNLRIRMRNHPERAERSLSGFRASSSVLPFAYLRRAVFGIADLPVSISFKHCCEFIHDRTPVWLCDYACHCTITTVLMHPDGGMLIIEHLLQTMGPLRFERRCRRPGRRRMDQATSRSLGDDQ